MNTDQRNVDAILKEWNQQEPMNEAYDQETTHMIKDGFKAAAEDWAKRLALSIAEDLQAAELKLKPDVFPAGSHVSVYLTGNEPRDQLLYIVVTLKLNEASDEAVTKKYKGKVKSFMKNTIDALPALESATHAKGLGLISIVGICEIDGLGNIPLKLDPSVMAP